MTKRSLLLLVLTTCALVATGLAMVLIPALQKDKTMPASQSLPALSDVPPTHWQALANTSIFFGHRSVGAEILDGVEKLIEQQPQIRLRLIETREPQGADEPALCHDRIGENRFPEKKFADFRAALNTGLAERCDLAMMKLCYIDFAPDSDPDALFQAYRQTVRQIQSEHPDLQLIHITTPLMGRHPSLKQRLKESLKSLLGRPPEWVAANKQRHRYNQAMRAEWGESPFFFDLARAESIDEEGLLHTRQDTGGGDIPVLAAHFTWDGGHLNKQGRRHVAEQLLVALAGAATRVSKTEN